MTPEVSHGEREQEGERVRERQEDIDSLVDALKAALPDSFADAAPSPFGPGEPWVKVQKEQQNVRGAVRHHLNKKNVAMYACPEWFRGVHDPDPNS